MYTDFVFTMHNPKIGDMHRLLSDDRVFYLVYQLEETSTEHIQGYVEFKGELEWIDVKETLSKAHYRFRRGTRQTARDYCMKNPTRIDGPWELGVWMNEREGDTETQCEGITTKGLRCKQRVMNNDTFCTQHTNTTVGEKYEVERIL